MFKIIHKAKIKTRLNVGCAELPVGFYRGSLHEPTNSKRVYLRTHVGVVDMELDYLPTASLNSVLYDVEYLDVELVVSPKA